MKKTRFLLLLGMILLGAIPAKSGDLYVYTNNSSKQSFSLDEFRTLTFTDTALVVTPKTGSPVAFTYTDLQFFTLKDDLSTGLNSAPSTVINNVKIYPTITSDLVTVTDVLNITGINLYDLHGRKLLQIKPESQKIDLSLASYPAGLYLLHVVDKAGTTVKKIIKN
jgi:hypothetical protein